MDSRFKKPGNRKFRNRSFCQLEADLIESEAFLGLSGKAAMICVIRFHQKAYRKRKNKRKKGGPKEMVITNQGEIIFTYEEGKELGIRSSRTFYKVIRELVEDKGFVDIAEPGNWYQSQPTRYSISERWRKFGTPAYQPVKIPRRLPDSVGFQKKPTDQPALYSDKSSRLYLDTVTEANPKNPGFTQVH